MNELLQKHGCANIFTIPEGLKELMSDISREVLREQPPKIYDFIANYLSVLLITREHGILAVRVLDDLCDCRPSVAEHLFEIGVTGEQALIIADIIKEEIEEFEPTEGKETVKEAQIIKRILTQVVLDEVKTAKVCQVARNAYRDYWYRKKLLEQNMKVTPEEPWEIAAERTLQIYKRTKPSFTELTRATEKIQAAYRGYHVRRNLLQHLKPKKKKKKPKVDLPGPPLDIAASREIDLGPLINLTVREDDVSGMFDAHATEKLGLPYDPQTAITHVEDMDFVEDEDGNRSRAPSRVADMKSTKSLLAPSQMPASEGLLERRRSRAASYAPTYMTEGGARQSRLPSTVPDPTPRQSRHPSLAPPPQLISFAEVILDDVTTEAQEVPEEIPDDRTEGDGESAPTASVPTSALDTDATDVEDIAEDITTSGEEGVE
ncbi:uncharacterized protein [Epargyreus clarus]|uniref:uncharacterized protein n=1 Tax=Epargyreus clarus TaxID=520877 RepID=UPI003C2DA353